MKVWHFSEMAYHPAWPELGELYRVIIPSRLFDPKSAPTFITAISTSGRCATKARHQHHDQRAPRDRDLRPIGFQAMIPTAIRARETKKVRLLALGMPIGNRNDPIRVAEEYR